MNLLKWLGEPVAHDRDYLAWKRRMGCERYGTPLKNFVKTLYKIPDIKISPRNAPNVGTIEDALVGGRAVVMKSAYMDRGLMVGHYYLITDLTEKSFFCVNLNQKHSWVPKAAFQFHWLQLHANYCMECGIAPYAWIIRPES